MHNKRRLLYHLPSIRNLNTTPCLPPVARRWMSWRNLTARIGPDTTFWWREAAPGLVQGWEKRRREPWESPAARRPWEGAAWEEEGAVEVEG